MVISVGVLILKHFLLGGLPQWPVDVIRVAQLPILGRLVGRPSALVGHREVEDEVPLHPIVLEVALHLDIPPLFAFAGRYSRLHAHLMAERAKERLELSDGPVVCLRRSSHRWTALGMIWHYTKIVLAAGAERAGMVH